MGNESSPTHIRNAAAVALKNFVRTNWQDGDAPLPDEEREDLRTTLLAKAFQVEILLFTEFYLYDLEFIFIVGIIKFRCPHFYVIKLPKLCVKLVELIFQKIGRV
jgi:hypothetical protein